LVPTVGKNTRSTRAIKRKEPQIHEHVKTAMFIKGQKTSEIVTAVMDDLYSLKKPAAIKYNKKTSNKMHPFEEATSIEYYSTKADSSLFVHGSHSKKRPHNITIGRLFNFHMLDLLELGIVDYKPIDDFNSGVFPQIGSKPCFTVIGSQFQTDSDYNLAANLFIDFFRGEIVQDINLKGLDHVISLTAPGNGTIQFRHYAIIMKKSATRIPEVELQEIGPSIDFIWRRSQWGAESLRREALQKPKILNPTKQKNVSRNKFQDKTGKVHVKPQQLERVHNNVKKPKALRKRNSILLEDDTPQPFLTNTSKKRKTK